MKVLLTRAAIGVGLVLILPAFAAMIFGSPLVKALSRDITTEEKMWLLEQAEIQGDAENGLL